MTTQNFTSTGFGNGTTSFNSTGVGNMTGMGNLTAPPDLSSMPAPTEEQIRGMLVVGMLLQITNHQFWDTNLTAMVDLILDGKHGNFTQWLNPLTQKAMDPTPALLGLQAWLKTVPHDNTFWHMASIYIVLQVLTLGTLLIRFYARKIHSGRVRPEDFWAVIAFVLSICYVIGLILSSKYGRAGYHLWDLSWNELVNNLKYMFAVSYFYPACMFTVKMALVSFYWSLSPNKVIRRILIAVFALIVVNFIIANLMLTFACRPVAFWNNVLASKCVNRIPMNTAWGTLNIISDIALWFLPVPAVWRLHLRLREKIGLVIMFGIGSIACIAAIIRVVVSNNFFKSYDITYGEAEISLWSLLEIDLAIMLLSAPAFKIVLMKHAPRIIGYTKRITSRNNSKTLSSKENNDSANDTIGKHGRKTPKHDDGRGGVLTIGSARGYRGDNSKITSKMNSAVSTFADGGDLSPVDENPNNGGRRLSALAMINPFQSPTPDQTERSDSTEQITPLSPSPAPAKDAHLQRIAMTSLSSPSSSRAESSREKDTEEISEKDRDVDEISRIRSTYS